jgi:hypothetical protein
VTGGRWRDGFVEPTELRGTKLWDFRLYGAKKTRPKRRTCARYAITYGSLDWIDPYSNDHWIDPYERMI